MRPPERIYLQVGEDAENSFNGITFPEQDQTWSDDRVFDTDVEYVIAPREKRLKRWREAEESK
jgi:hypothetical protein